MSYKLIDANNITFNSDGFITAENIEKMPCIYADLPNGMDGEHYVLEQQSMLDKIRAEIEQNAYLIVHGVNNHELGMTLYGILQILDKYKAESEDKE